MGAYTPTAREYLRVSKDKSGRMRSVAETHEENAEHAEREGWILGEPYAEEKAIGASKHSIGVRAGFESLVADLEAGRFGAEILIMWASSRGSRRLSEWARFLELLQDNKVKLYITSHSRLYDLSHWRDMRTMQEDGSDNEAEIAKMRVAVIRGLTANATNGEPHSVVNVGLQVIRDPRTGKRTGWEIDETKAPLIEELFRRVHAGDSFKSIERDWASRGYLNGAGKPYSAQHLRDLATKAAYTGLRKHKGQLIEATWPAIVPRALWWEVQRILSGPSHQNPARRPGRAHYVYSRIIRCDVCGEPLTIQAANKYYTKNGRRHRRKTVPLVYRCRHVDIKKDEVDEILDAAIVKYLSHPDIYQRVYTSDHSERVDAIEARLARARAELDEAEREEPATVHEARALGKLVEGLTRRITEDEQALRKLTVPAPLAAMIAPGEDVAARWKNASVAVKRRVATIVLSSEHLGEVRITQARTWQPPVIDRIEWRQTGG